MCERDRQGEEEDGLVGLGDSTEVESMSGIPVGSGDGADVGITVGDGVGIKVGAADGVVDGDGLGAAVQMKTIVKFGALGLRREL